MNTAKLLKLAFLGSIVTFVLVTELVVRTGSPTADGATAVKMLGPIMIAVYAMIVIGAPFFMRSVRAKQGEPDDEQKVTSRAILQMAFYESGAVYGLVLSFLSHERYWVHGFATVAFALILLTIKTEPDN